MGMGPNVNALSPIQPSEYFLKALEAQRSINTQIHEIEPSTPIFLYEIDLNEIKPATASYPGTSGPVKDGVIRIHNDFNLFNINRGIIEWRGKLFFPFPIYGEQFDITSNGTIPTPKVKFSSQFLDDEFNSFYKYIRMQINELKDIVGSKVTRRKTFVRYLHPNNFPGKVNPFNSFTDTPWASRDGEVLTIRTMQRVPFNFSKWITYYFRANYDSSAIFTCLRSDDKLKTLNIDLQNPIISLQSFDIFNLLVNWRLNLDETVNNTFTSDIFVLKKKNNFSNLILENQNEEYSKLNSTEKVKFLCSSYDVALNNSINTSINYPTNFSLQDGKLTTFVSFRPYLEELSKPFKFSINSQSTGMFSLNFSEQLSGVYEVNYLTIPTGIYTGIEPFTKDSTQLMVLNLSNNFGALTSGELQIDFPRPFKNIPKILFNSWGTAGFKYHQYLNDISNIGCKFIVSHTGDNFQLGTQNINLLATDYVMDKEFSTTGNNQIYSAYHNLAKEFETQIDKKNIDIYEVELTPDIYYIDRKTQEDSINVVYELASLLDIEGIKLPGRILLSKNCPFVYRGEGCVYERHDRLTEAHSGSYGQVYGITYPTTGTSNAVILPPDEDQQCIGIQNAPPVATDTDEIFANKFTSGSFIDCGSWQESVPYSSGNYIYVEKNLIKYYFVCSTSHTSSALNAPPNQKYWLSDSCSKTLKGCRLRWSENPWFPIKTINANHEFTSRTTFTGVTGQGLLPQELFQTNQGYALFIQDPQVLVVDTLLKRDIRAPKDKEGNQLLGILPFGGFPSVEGKYQSQQGPDASI